MGWIFRIDPNIALVCSHIFSWFVGVFSNCQGYIIVFADMDVGLAIFAVRIGTGESRTSATDLAAPRECILFVEQHFASSSQLNELCHF